MQFLIGCALAAVACVTLLDLRAGEPLERAQLSARWPRVVAAALPKDLGVARTALLQGTVRPKVTTDGERVVDVQSDGMFPILTPVLTESVRSWRLAPHQPSVFETSFTFAFRPDRKDPGCSVDSNLHVTLRLPTDVEVLADPPGHCFRSYERDPREFVVAEIAGVVRCDCPENSAVGGAYLSLAGPVTMSGPDGSFQMAALPPGQYELQVEAGNFEAKIYRVRVTPQAAKSQTIDVRLRKIPGAAPPPPAVVSDAAMATYPEDARVKGIEGNVRLRGAEKAPSSPRSTARRHSAAVRWRTSRPGACGN